MNLEAFNPEHFHPEERASIYSLREGMLIELPGHPQYLLIGPVHRDAYRQADGRERCVLFASRVTRDGKLGPITIRCGAGQIFTIRRPGAGTETA
jgi:hypothetical protein